MSTPSITQTALCIQYAAPKHYVISPRRVHRRAQARICNSLPYLGRRRSSVPRYSKSTGRYAYNLTSSKHTLPILYLLTRLNIKDSAWKQKRGFEKVEGSCHRAKLDGYEYIWIDTCCIDKRSSAELSEAINSMFAWYESANVCYAFLEDVQDQAGLPTSRWFTRGWTLQELIAPHDVQFYNKNWEFLGDRYMLSPQIAGQHSLLY